MSLHFFSGFPDGYSQWDEGKVNSSMPTLGYETSYLKKNKPAPYLALATGFLNVYLKKILML